jgi:hypothetical protein
MLLLCFKGQLLLAMPQQFQLVCTISDMRSISVSRCCEVAINKRANFQSFMVPFIHFVSKDMQGSSKDFTFTCLHCYAHDPACTQIAQCSQRIALLSKISSDYEFSALAADHPSFWYSYGHCTCLLASETLLIDRNDHTPCC